MFHVAYLEAGLLLAGVTAAAFPVRYRLRSRPLRMREHVRPAEPPKREEPSKKEEPSKPEPTKKEEPTKGKAEGGGLERSGPTPRDNPMVIGNWMFSTNQSWGPGPVYFEFTNTAAIPTSGMGFIEIQIPLSLGPFRLLKDSPRPFIILIIRPTWVGGNPTPSSLSSFATTQRMYGTSGQAWTWLPDSAAYVAGFGMVDRSMGTTWNNPPGNAFQDGSIIMRVFHQYGSGIPANCRWLLMTFTGV